MRYIIGLYNPVADLVDSLIHPFKLRMLFQLSDYFDNSLVVSLKLESFLRQLVLRMLNPLDLLSSELD